MTESIEVTYHLLDTEHDGEWKNTKTYCGLSFRCYPENHFWTEEHLAAVRLAKPNTIACPTCFPEGKPRFGTPLSELSGRPGHDGFEEWCRISRSWGYD